ncbi:hypothetical protein [Paenibacillus sp. FSL W8-0194]|uniref:hypothetical protein n=1 Tax=Paenibacillus sp. FSL W8-0194 TaxID=2921711 RepID=UPI0030D8D722
MEAKNACTTISNSEMIKLLEAAKQKDRTAMLKLIDLFRDDILRISQFIHLPKEDAISTIITEFLELVQASDNNGVMQYNKNITKVHSNFRAIGHLPRPDPRKTVN